MGVTVMPKTTAVQEIAKATPPVVAYFTGLTTHDWAAIATIAYVVLQASYLVWKWWREARRAAAEATP